MTKFRFTILLLAILLTACKPSADKTTFNVMDYGAVGDGVTSSTDAFNAAVEACSKANGVVLVPEGKYLCGTIVLESNVELRLEEGAEILGDTTLTAYKSFIPKRDMSQYDSGDGTLNQNNSRDERWNRALILANDAENVSITGDGIINGRHVFDSLGEEHMRGPHAVVFGDCRNVKLEGVKIHCAANYAFLGYALKDASFHNVTICEGWDGIHIRGGENVKISKCTFETGDDCIAGGYWKNMEITNCSINSSCNGIRMIMPSENVDIHDCTFKGPGKYPHRTSGAAKRCNMLFGVVFEPGGWGKAPGELSGLVVRDCTMENTQAPVAVSISEDNVAHDLTISNVHATGTYGTMSPVINYNDKGFEHIVTNNYTIER